MMTGGQTAPIIDQATPVSGEQPTVGDGMEVAPGVDPVTPWHRGTG